MVTAAVLVNVAEVFFVTAVLQAGAAVPASWAPVGGWAWSPAPAWPASSRQAAHSSWVCAWAGW